MESAAEAPDDAGECTIPDLTPKPPQPQDVEEAHVHRWIITLGLVAGLIVATTATAAPTWSQVKTWTEWQSHSEKTHKDAGQVKVLKSTIDGVYCFKGEANADLDPEIMYEVAADIEGTLTWSTAGVTEAATLSSGGSTIDYYQYLNVPGWTMTKDRFWFLSGTVERSGGAVTFWWTRLEDGGPYNAKWTEVKEAHPKAIEPPVNVGAWVFTPADSGTDIEYFICTDTGGAIPESLAATATTTTLPDTVGDLVREAAARSK